MEWISTLVTSQAQSVPEGLRTCEFDCDEPFCSPERWHTCERRLSFERSSSSPLAIEPVGARARTTRRVG